MSEKLSVFYVDEDGDEAVHIYPITDGTTDPEAAGIETFLQATADISHAAIPGQALTIDVVNSDVAGTGPYDVEDKMVLTFKTFAGNTVKLPIPAPIRTLMETDDESFDIAEAALDDFVTDALLYLVDKGASALKEYIKSKRGRKNRKS